jgi:hypothetical protein
MRRTDAVHFALMLAALGLSYLLPFELVLLSYVFLGPPTTSPRFLGCMTANIFSPIAVSRWR